VATQRLTVATLAGRAAAAVAARFEQWRTVPDPEGIDQFCTAIREHALSLPVVYFTEWVDRWLMGDTVPGPNALEGRRFQASVVTPEQAIAWADRCGHQFPEQQWLACRLREAARTVVIIREVCGLSTTDTEVRAALGSVPDWAS
jgi:hypothetical protein